MIRQDNVRVDSCGLARGAGCSLEYAATQTLIVTMRGLTKRISWAESSPWHFYSRASAPVTPSDVTAVQRTSLTSPQATNRIRVHSGDPNVLLTLLFDANIWYNFQGVGVCGRGGGQQQYWQGEGPGTSLWIGACMQSLSKLCCYSRSYSVL